MLKVSLALSVYLAAVALHICYLKLKGKRAHMPRSTSKLAEHLLNVSLALFEYLKAATIRLYLYAYQFWHCSRCGQG